MLTHSQHNSIYRRLFHDTHELIQINRPIPILVELINHSLQLLIAQLLTQLTRHSSQVADVDGAGLVVVEQCERLLDLVVGVALGQLISQQDTQYDRQTVSVGGG